MYLECDHSLLYKLLSSMENQTETEGVHMNNDLPVLKPHAKLQFSRQPQVSERAASQFQFSYCQQGCHHIAGCPSHTRQCCVCVWLQLLNCIFVVFLQLFSLFESLINVFMLENACLLFIHRDFYFSLGRILFPRRLKLHDNISNYRKLEMEKNLSGSTNLVLRCTYLTFSTEGSLPLNAQLHS